MELKPGTYNQTAAVLRESRGIWGAGFTADDYLRLNTRLAKHPWSKEHFRHLVLLDKVSFLRSSCKLHELSARVKNKSIRIALISELFTPPRERRRGFAGVLMEMLIAQLRNEGFDLAVLFSDLPTRFFTRFGFTEIDKYDLVFDLIIPAQPRKKIVEALRKVPEAVRQLHRKSCSPDFYVERSADYWDFLRYKKTQLNRLQWDLGRESLHLSEDGTSYAWTRWTGQRMEIKDVAYTDPHALADIFAHLLQKHGPGILQQAHGWLPPRFERLPFVTSTRYLQRTMGIFMAADLAGAPKKFAGIKPYDLQFWALDRI